MRRRQFLAAVGSAVLGQSAADPVTHAFAARANAAMPVSRDAGTSQHTTLFLCGDVMTGRGIDQILPYPGNPQLHEPYVRSALRYVEIAEEATGPIARPVDVAYIWGDALAELDRVRPDARIINLETAITTADDAWPSKGIHYRMHPANIGCLAAAAIDCCSLANNHVLDWAYRGLSETLVTSRTAGIRTAGAAADQDEAGAPAIIELADQRRVLVFAFGMDSAGVPREWAAAKFRAGVGSWAICRISRRRPPMRSPRTWRPSSATAISPSRRSTGAATGDTTCCAPSAGSRGSSSIMRESTSCTGTRRITRKESRSIATGRSSTDAATS